MRPTLRTMYIYMIRSAQLVDNVLPQLEIIWLLILFTKAKEKKKEKKNKKKPNAKKTKKLNLTINIDKLFQ